jgi:MoaA/NifB/PqqE/SkfB family radical SAM enzyme
MKREVIIAVDDKMLSLFPSGTARGLGVLPGTEWALEPTEEGIIWRRLEDNLLKLYIEVTNSCNLNCRTCVRNVWDEPEGFMSEGTFDRFVEHLGELGGVPMTVGTGTGPAPGSHAGKCRTGSSVRTVHFGGYGEPMAHPRIFEMLRRVKALGLRTEMISNGTLLDEARCHELVDSELDLLIISIDGARDLTYGSIRQGAELSSVLENLKGLSRAWDRSGKLRPELRLSFVAMKDNLNELLALKRIAVRLRASQLMVSNLLPHTQDMLDQVLYSRLTATANPVRPEPKIWDAMVSLPRIDWSPGTTEVMRRLLHGRGNVEMPAMDWGARVHYCRFVQEGTAFVRWDGEVAPCMPLLYSYQCFVLRKLKHVVAHSFGSINECTLAEIWESQDYCDFRRRVRNFEFSPCVDCGGCDMGESNQEDCFGNSAPVCGDCLWAQGIIQCP